MDEYTYSITENTTRRPESITESTGFIDWYDNVDEESLLDEAVELGYIEATEDDDPIFLETVLEVAREMNHGPEWIKEIMDSEREFGNPYLEIAENAEENDYTIGEVMEEYKERIAIDDWCISANRNAKIKKVVEEGAK